MATASHLAGPCFRAALINAGEYVCAVREELCALDAVAGDGDLGVTLASGFSQARVALEASASTDVGAMLVVVGSELARKAPSTMGALLSTALLRAGGRLAGAQRLSAPDVAIMLEAAATGVADRGHAQIGQRTVLDAMLPAATAASITAKAGGEVIDVLEAARAAAADGAALTATMEPQLGRAAWIKDRARGSRDAGAEAWAVFLAGFADGAQSGATHPVVALNAAAASGRANTSRPHHDGRPATPEQS